jgi:hypothetical protein
LNDEQRVVALSVAALRLVASRGRILGLTPEAECCRRSAACANPRAVCCVNE